MKKFVVTGGGGFVGKALCKALKKQGHQVTAIARGDYPDLLQMGVLLVNVDLSHHPEKLIAVFQGAEAVFHTAAKVSLWGEDYEDFYRHNVLPTQNVLAACRPAGVKKLIFNCSTSVVFDGSNLLNADESTPYPKEYRSLYAKTKALAEQMVLAANSADLYTLSLRFPVIWGPGDKHTIPSILKKTKSGCVFQIGNWQNRHDLIYIDDCVQANLKACDALSHNPSARGKAYFITQGRPVHLWAFINKVLEFHKTPPIKIHLPVPIAMGMAACMEWISKCLPSHPEPLLYRYLVSSLAAEQFFNIGAARQILGYEPIYVLNESCSNFSSLMNANPDL